MKTALIICTYNRPDYLESCFESVLALDEKSTDTYVIDDRSTSVGIVRQIKSFCIGISGIENDGHSHFKPFNSGVKDSLLIGFDWAFKDGCDLAINIDSDAIVKPNFITRIKDLKQRFPDRIISGFNCNHPRNPILFDGEDYVERRHCNGINMAIDKQQYESIVRPALLKPTGNWDFDSTYDKPFIISKPSIVQHIGMVSSMGHQGADVACDW